MKKTKKKKPKQSRGLGTPARDFGSRPKQPSKPRKNKSVKKVLRMLAMCAPTRWRTRKERRIWHAKQELESFSSLLGIRDQVKHRAWNLYQKAYSMGLTQGIQKELTILALIYYASMEAGGSLQLKEICKKAQVDRKKLFATYKRLKRKMGLKNIIRKSEDLLQKSGCEVGATQPQIETARKLVEKGAFQNRAPRVAAATSLHIAMGKKKVKWYFAYLCNTHPTSIRNALKCHKKKHLAMRCLAPQTRKFWKFFRLSR